MRRRRVFQCSFLKSISVIAGFLFVSVNVVTKFHQTVLGPDISPFSKLTLIDLKLNKKVNMLEARPWWNIWNGDLNCTRHSVHLLQFGSHPHPGALVSFPGSGNTWLRSLLMGITGVYVTSVYVDETRNYLPDGKDNKSYQIPIDCGCSLLQKTHDFSMSGVSPTLIESNNLTQTIEAYRGKGILIIRDPYKAIASYRNFQFGGKTGLAPESAFQGDDWDYLVNQSIAGWETLARVWIRGLKQGGVVYYEKLRREPRSELNRLMTMLNFKYDPERFECALRHINHNAMKRKVRQNIRHRYSAIQRMKIQEAIENVQSELKERGMMPLPIELYS